MIDNHKMLPRITPTHGIHLTTEVAPHAKAFKCLEPKSVI